MGCVKDKIMSPYKANTTKNCQQLYGGPKKPGIANKKKYIQITSNQGQSNYFFEKEIV